MSSFSGTIWLQLMESGAFDDHYPQRLNACFHYLSENAASFAIKDLAQKAAFVFSYLSLDVDAGSQNGVMDVFGLFNRSGNGNITLEDFLIGIIEHLLLKHSNHSLLSGIASDLLGMESRAIELATLLEKPSKSTPRIYKRSLEAMSAVIRGDIRASRSRVPVLTAEGLVEVCRRAIAQVVDEIVRYFHLSSARLTSLMMAMPTETVTPLVMVWSQGSDHPPSASASASPSASGTPAGTPAGTPSTALRRASMSDPLARGRSRSILSTPLLPLAPSSSAIPTEEVEVDSNQLHLLQRAFESLEYFFTLKGDGSAPPVITGRGDPAHGHNNIPAHPNNKGTPEKDGKTAAASDPRLLAAAAAGSSSDSQNLALTLAEELFSTQTRLSAMTNKCTIYEMIQMDRLRRTPPPAASSGTSEEVGVPAHGNDSYGRILTELSALANELPVAIVPLDSLLLDEASSTDLLQRIYALEQTLSSLPAQQHNNPAHNNNNPTHPNNSSVGNDQVSVAEELRHAHELYSIEKNDLFTIHVEVQILRDKLIKAQSTDNLIKLLEEKNMELAKKLKEYEAAGHQHPTGNANSSANPSDRTGNAIPSAHPSGQASIPSAASTSTSSASADDDTPLDATSFPAYLANPRIPDSQKVVKLSSYCQSLIKDCAKWTKENKQIATNLSYLDKRLKGSLADQMTLINSSAKLDEENAAFKSTITRLSRDLEEHKVYKHQKDELTARLYTLENEILYYQTQLSEAASHASVLDKYHADIIAAERAIEGYEQKISEYAIELEKGQIAQSQLEGFREQVKAKSKEVRDMSLHIHGLETQLKELPALHARYTESLATIEDYRNKIDKIPGLLAEIARLRGSARASVKALTEQDKLLTAYKNRVKILEKEAVMLKHDNRTMQDVENKLKDAHGEIKRLMTCLAEGKAEKAESTPTSGGNTKKMQKYMRQTAYFATNPVGRTSVVVPGPPLHAHPEEA